MSDDPRDSTALSSVPRLHEFHSDPAARKTGELPARLKTPVQEKSPAQWAYERMILYIQKFEETLDNTQEVAMGFTGAEAGVLRIEGMGYFDPDMVTFYGTDLSGARTQLIQHVSQLSVMLRALPKTVEEAEPTRIGFRLAAELEDHTEESATE